MRVDYHIPPRAACKAPSFQSWLSGLMTSKEEQQPLLKVLNSSPSPGATTRVEISCSLGLSQQGSPEAWPLLCSWPDRIWMHCAEAMSHTRPVPSALPVSASRPSASTAAQFTCTAAQLSQLAQARGRPSCLLNCTSTITQQAASRPRKESRKEQRQPACGRGKHRYA